MPKLTLEKLNEKLNNDRIFLNASEILKVLELVQKENAESQRKETDALLFEKMKQLAAEAAALEQTEVQPGAVVQPMPEKTPELPVFLALLQNEEVALQFAQRFADDFVTEINQAAANGEIRQEVAQVIREIEPQAFVPVVQQAAAAAMAPRPVPLQSSAAPQQAAPAPQARPVIAAATTARREEAEAEAYARFTMNFSVGVTRTVQVHCEGKGVLFTQQDSATVLATSIRLASRQLDTVLPHLTPAQRSQVTAALIRLGVVTNNSESGRQSLESSTFTKESTFSS